MLIKVKSSRSGEYTVDTEAVTCTCPDFRFRGCHNAVTSENRQCKHIRQVFADNPELMPPLVASAMRRLDNQLKAVTEDSNLTFPKSLIESYHTTITSYLTCSLVPVGDFAKGLNQCKSLDYLVKKGTFNKQEFESCVDLIGFVQKESDSEIHMLGDGYIPINFLFVKDEEFVYKEFFGTMPDDEIQKVVNRSYELGYNLTPTGLGGKEAEVIKTVKDLYKFLNLPQYAPIQ